MYTGSVDEVGGDVVMRGKLDLVLKSGTALEVDFAARMVVDDALSAEPKVALCQLLAVWISIFLFGFSLTFNWVEKLD